MYKDINLPVLSCTILSTLYILFVKILHASSCVKIKCMCPFFNCVRINIGLTCDVCYVGDNGKPLISQLHTCTFIYRKIEMKEIVAVR